MNYLINTTSRKEIGSGFSTMLKEYNAKREDQEAQLEKIHRELGEATQNAAKLEKERNQLHNSKELLLKMLAT